MKICKLQAICANTWLIFNISTFQMPIENEKYVGWNDGKIKVAIIDTGVFTEKTFPETKVIRYDARARNNGITHAKETGPRWSSRHGTWVASIILKRISKPVEILSYRVDNYCPTETSCELSVAAVYNAASHAAKQGADIIQISATGELDVTAQSVLRNIAARGVHIVIAAGNDGKVSPLIPLAKKNQTFIHVVGALDVSGNQSAISNYEETKGFLHWKIGENIRANDPNGITRIVQGTSYAASVFTAELINEFRA